MYKLTLMFDDVPHTHVKTYKQYRAYAFYRISSGVGQMLTQNV